MTNRQKKRMLSVMQLVVAMAMFPLFFYWATWLSAEPRGSAVQRFDVFVPAEWKNVVVGGGKATEWPRGTVSEEPVTFTFLSTVLAACFVSLWASVWYASRLTKEDVIITDQPDG